MERGVVVRFDADRGFGFIRSRAYRDDVFVHVDAVAGRTRLRAGQRVRFEARPDDRGPRATRVEPGRMGPSPAVASVSGLVVALAVLAFGLNRLGLPWRWTWPAAIGPLTFLVYAWDKRRAGRGLRRVPEAFLLILAFIGGTPGAVLAMATLHHKIRKRSFLTAFAGVVVAQAAVLCAAWRFWPA